MQKVVSSLPKTVMIGFLSVTIAIMAGCSKPQSAKPPQEVAVKAVAVIQKDTPVVYEFIGEVEPKEEVQLRAQVSGNIVESLVKGGDVVRKGQPLFRIDPRQYNTTLLDNQAQLAEAEAALSRVRRDVARYQSLSAQGAVAQQTLDNLLAEERQTQARVNAYVARMQQAQYDVEDTLITSPLDGKIDIKEVSTGNYIAAGQTVVATISTVDPVRVKFAMSENEYLKFARSGASPMEWGQGVKLVLSDGTAYPVTGKVEQVDRGLAQQTGTLTLKATFNNPQKLLVPGMFARVVIVGETRKAALMIPQRAIQELLGKTFVTVVGEGDKSETRPIKVGPKVENMLIVEEGLNPQDRVVVEGFAKTQPGMPLKVTMVSPEEIQIPASK